MQRVPLGKGPERTARYEESPPSYRRWAGASQMLERADKEQKGLTMVTWHFPQLELAGLSFL